MWRSLVLALGLTLCVLGGEFMVVDRLILAEPQSAASSYANPYLDNDYLGASDVSRWGSASSWGRKVFVPPEWAPWGLLSAGVLTLLYGATNPVRSSE